MAPKDEKKKVDIEIVTAIYKVNLHCLQCAHDIRKPLMRTQGVHSVECDIEKSEIKVKGVIDVTKIHKHIEKFSRKKVELVESSKEKVVKETKMTIRTISIKVFMHCDQCEIDLREKLLRHKDIYEIKTDIKAHSLTVEGTIESDKLLTYLRKKVHKNAEIISIKHHEKKEEKGEKEVEVKITESTEIIEFKTEKKVEAITIDGSAPYFVHYVYSPQLFCDENPNACIVM